MLWGVPLSVLWARGCTMSFSIWTCSKNADGSFDWGSAVAIWDGGLAIYGAVIAAILVGADAVPGKKEMKLGAMTDLVVMGLLIGQTIGRWANFINREAFGDCRPLCPGGCELWTTVLRKTIEVHPTFLYESLWNVVGLLLIVFVVSKGRRFDGENTWFYFLWYGMGRFWVEGLRTDSLYLFDWTIVRSAHPGLPGPESGDGAGVGVHAVLQHQASSPQAGGAVCQHRGRPQSGGCRRF